MSRNYFIDNLRGIAFLFMVFQHIFYLYDVSNGYLTSFAKNPIVDLSGHIARTLFILLSGYTLYISYKKNDKEYIKNRFKRSLEIFGHALIITVFTYYVYPDYFIRFGILHFLALSTLLISPLVPYPKLTILIFIISLLIKFPPINPLIDTITGAVSHYNVMDSFVLNKWLPLLIFGLIMGQNNMLEESTYLSKPSILSELGNSSLEFYTLHFIILGLFYKVYKK